MFVTQRDYLAQKEYYKDQMCAAKRYCLARQVLAGRSQGSHLPARALMWLGGRLAAWGSTLLERYGTVPSAAGVRSS